MQPAKKNPYAKAVRTPLFRMRVIKNKKKEQIKRWTRKKET
jgi:hypothetical protein